MKRILFVVLAFVGVLSARGAVYDYFIVSQADGSEITLPVEGLVITFDGDNLLASAGDIQETIALTQLSSMRFSETPSGIFDMNDVASRATVSGRTLTVSAPEGSRVVVADVSGRLIFSGVVNDGRISLGLHQGVYVVKINEKSQKICVR